MTALVERQGRGGRDEPFRPESHPESHPEFVPEPRASRHDPTPRAVVMIRPHHFTPNPQTATDNAFQAVPSRPSGEVASAAYAEVTRAVQHLRDAGVTVHLFEDTATDRPDAVFCNNWFSTHADGRIMLYPMRMANRQRERREDVLADLARRYRVSEVEDLSGYAHRGRFLEGTGVMVFDHHHGRAFISRSGRAHATLARAVCADLGVEPVLFDTAGPDGEPIYHTNVMLAVGRDIAVAGLEAIPDPVERRRVHRLIEADGARRVIALDPDQIAAFAGNMLELSAAGQRVLAMSQTAERSLHPWQRRAIEQSCALLPLAVPTLELAGGSVRCMLADIHLPPRS